MNKKLILLTIFLLVSSIQTGFAQNRIYPVVSGLNVRNLPSTKSRIITKLPILRWVATTIDEKGWTKISLPSGKTGYVYTQLTSDMWIKVIKKERKLYLLKGDTIKAEYPIALGGNPLDDKNIQGDESTPEGRFFICEMIKKPKNRGRYGARSMRISYPNIEDARRGLKQKLITKSEYRSIVRQVSKAKMPPQTTALGGSIRIHGGGAGQDWTLGCIAMHDKDIIDLYERLPEKNTLVEIYKDSQADAAFNRKGYLNEKSFEGAKKLLKAGCKYTTSATALIKMDYPEGDIDPGIGVCTDVVIRALRNGGIDLQALLYEDIIMNPGRYPAISKPNTNIDHRRTRNLKIWFDHHARVLKTVQPSSADSKSFWLPGDIVIMDTGVANGTPFDHIGIVSDKKTLGIPLVINLWTIGWDIKNMNLLTGVYPTINGHYRLLHPFDYAASIH
ncbi:DUF1287 domain-containing protein [Desulfobacterales bacterium HSG16]|nr:DUF1287 domain-containing protein [Desulfobacterales bacterium HSG16]